MFVVSGFACEEEKPIYFSMHVAGTPNCYVGGRKGLGHSCRGTSGLRFCTKSIARLGHSRTGIGIRSAILMIM